MPVYTDQLGRTIDLPHAPRRIVSLVPSITELLYSLQLHEQVVGITKFCVHPESWFKQKTRVGGTKTVKFDIIHQLQPDLIIANKEENVKDQIDELARHYPVWVSDVNNMNDAFDMMRAIGTMTGTVLQTARLIHDIENSFLDLTSQKSTLTDQNKKPGTGYLIWRDPYMTVGGDTFINDMLNRAGFANIFEPMTRYPVITIEDLKTASCELLLLSSEPFPFKQKHIEELKPHLPNTRIELVDGELFSWYGSRLLQAPSYFTGLLRRLY